MIHVSYYLRVLINVCIKWDNVTFFKHSEMGNGETFIMSF